MKEYKILPKCSFESALEILQSTQIPTYNTWLREIAEAASGRDIVSVLGAFDTWPLMDYVAKKMAVKSNNFLVLTSRYNYFHENGKTIQIIKQHESFKNSPMRDSLKNMILHSNKVVIIYTISAAHYVESDWCFELCRNKKDFKVYGLTFVRNIQIEKDTKPIRKFTDPEIQMEYDRLTKTQMEEKKNCPNLVVKPCYSYCKAYMRFGKDWRAWECIEQVNYENRYCPFVHQDISKNIIEYFTTSPKMKMYAVDTLEGADHLSSYSFK